MINTTLCYLEKNDSYLMLHRTKKENDYNKDKWIGIGGKFEEDESPHDCAKREIFEETGIVVNDENLEYRGIVTFISHEDKIDDEGKSYDKSYYEFMHLFWTKDFTEPEMPHICDEGDLEWVPISKMNDLPHWEGDEIFLDLLQKKSPFFSLKLVYKNGDLIDWKLNMCRAAGGF